MSSHTTTAITVMTLTISIATVLTILIFMNFSNQQARQEGYVENGYIQCVVERPGHYPATLWVFPENCDNIERTK